MPRLPPATWLILATGIAVAVGVVVGPALGAPLSLAAGAPDSEGPLHLAQLAASLDDFWVDGPWFDRRQDPSLRTTPMGVSTICGYPIWLLAGGGVAGAVLAWNWNLLLTIVGAAAGGWALAGAVGGPDPSGRGRAAAAVMCALAPCLLQHAEVGRLENGALYWLPLHWGLMLRLAQRPAAEGRSVGPVAAAALSLAAVTAQGGYPAVIAAVCELPLLWVCWRRSRRAGPLLAAAIGLLLALPFAWSFALAPPTAFTEGRPYSPTFALEGLLPWGGRVPLSFGYEERPYPGLALVGLAVWSVLASRGRGAWPLAGAAGLLVVALGPDLYLTTGGRALARIPLGWLMEVMPDAWPRSGWTRVGLLVAPLLVAASARLLAARPRAAPWLLLLVAADALLYVHQIPGRRGAWSAAPPPALVALSEVERVVVVPADARLALWAWSGDHPGLPTRPFLPLPDEPMMRWLTGLLPSEAPAFRRAAPAIDLAPGCIGRGALELNRAGYTALWVGDEGVDPATWKRVAGGLDSALGPRRPDIATGQVWSLVPLVVDCAQGGGEAPAPPGPAGPGADVGARPAG